MTNKKNDIIHIIDEIKKPKVKAVENLITQLSLNGFSGRIEVNFQYGSIASVQKYEKVDLDKFIN